MTDTVTLPYESLSALMPMCVLIADDGAVDGMGPTMRRIAAGRRLDRSIGDLFVLRNHEARVDPDTLASYRGRRIRLAFREGRRVHFRGHYVPRDGGGGILNLSLSVSELGDLGGAALTSGDFAPTDATLDMLYLLEARGAAMAEARRLIARLEGAKSHAELQALTDTLTGLANRRALDLAVARQVRQGAPFALTQVDLDFFKQVNDRLGHAAGDHVLTEVAQRLRETCRGTDVIARTGGDEFVVLFPGLHDVALLEKVVERAIEVLQRPILWEGEHCRISASLGTALSINYDRPNPERMLQDADRALYESKANGRSRHTMARAS